MIWIIIFVATIIFELITSVLVSLSFSIGAVGAFILLKCGASIPVQIITFLVVSGLSIWLLKPLRERFLKKNIVKTNVDAIIGEVGVVVEEINNNAHSYGAVRVKGLVYTALSHDEEPIQKDEKIIVERVDGVKLIVRKADQITSTKETD